MRRILFLSALTLFSLLSVYFLICSIITFTNPAMAPSPAIILAQSGMMSHMNDFAFGFCSGVFLTLWVAKGSFRRSED
ncbi:ABC-type Na+ efflux pump permease subunit [Rhabdobacter roseus]|uniref:ABC-type Na+ efflux pump permease subunit n=1 Tax=Rhabdobacter roseus TaxID=1655419 RepID=A0A840TVZ0_9BACT|nr:ABC-type Na+ efflux pump permease subunit [Rhabdobacter roseus]